MRKHIDIIKQLLEEGTLSNPSELPINPDVLDDEKKAEKERDYANLQTYLDTADHDHEYEPLEQNELPHLFAQEFPNANWLRLADTFLYSGPMRGIAEKIFSPLAKVSVGDIFVLSTMLTHDVKSVHDAVDWISKHATIQDDRLRYTFDFLPDYVATGKLYHLKHNHISMANDENRSVDCKFLIIFDDHGEYVYAWADPIVQEGRTFKDNDYGKNKKFYNRDQSRNEKRSQQDKRWYGNDDDLEENAMPDSDDANDYFAHNHQVKVDEFCNSKKNEIIENEEENDFLSDEFESIAGRISFGYVEGMYSVNDYHGSYKLEVNGVSPHDLDNFVLGQIADSVEEGNIEGQIHVDTLDITAYWYLKVSVDSEIAKEYPSTRMQESLEEEMVDEQILMETGHEFVTYSEYLKSRRFNKKIFDKMKNEINDILIHYNESRGDGIHAQFSMWAKEQKPFIKLFHPEIPEQAIFDDSLINHIEQVLQDYFNVTDTEEKHGSYFITFED